jgi:quinol monooxygenase YgiN
MNTNGNNLIKTFCVNVNLHIKPSKRDAFLKVIQQNQQGTLKNEPLAKLYVWGESTTEPNTFHFQEQYVGEAGFKAHTQSEHFKQWEKFANHDDSPFTKPPEVFLFELNN